jgi:DNA-binding protein YbaB
MFDKAKMLAQAFKLKKAVEAEMVSVEENGVAVEVSGDQKIRKLVINGVENRVVIEVINRAMKKAQETAARKMKEMGGLGGLF